MPRTYVEKIAAKKGVPIVDAKHHASVMVTSSDVVNSQKANSRDCALSRASCRIPGVKRGYFFRGTAYLEYPDRMERYVLPPSVQKEIVSFDRAKIMAPGSYQLAPPSASRSKKASANYRAERQKVLTEAVLRKESANKSAPVLKGKNSKVSNKAPLTSAIRKIASQDKPNPTKEQKVFEAKVAKVLDQPKKQVHRTQYVRDAREPK